MVFHVALTLFPYTITIAPLPVSVLVGTAASGATLTGSGTLTICDGEEVTFSTSGGARYEFFDGTGLSRQASSTSQTFSSTTLGSGDIIFARVYNAAGCFSQTDSITINESAAIALNVTPISTVYEFCTGAPIAMQATPIPGALYEWQINGIQVRGPSLQSTHTSGAGVPDLITDGDIVTVIVTTGAGCTITATTTFIENAISRVGTLTTATPTMCAGVPASTIVGQASVVSGTTTIYEWSRSTDLGVTYTPIGGTNSVSYSPGNLASTTLFIRKTTSVLNGLSCSVNTLPYTITIAPLPVSVLVGTAASGATLTGSGTLTICDGEEVTFSTSGGARYEFFDGTGLSRQASSTSQTFSSTTLGSGDIIFARVYNAAGCFSQTDSITINESAAIALNVTPISTVYEFCTGAPIAMQATPIPGALYEWQINGIQVRGPSLQSTHTSGAGVPDLITDGDIVTVIVTTGAGCTITATTTFIENAISRVGTLTTATPTMCAGVPASTIVGQASVVSGTTTIYEWVAFNRFGCYLYSYWWNQFSFV